MDDLIKEQSSIIDSSVVKKAVEDLLLENIQLIEAGCFVPQTLADDAGKIFPGWRETLTENKMRSISTGGIIVQ